MHTNIHRVKTHEYGRMCPNEAAAHLGRRSILLNSWRQGAAVDVRGRRLYIVVAKAAEQRAEDAPAPLLLYAAV